MTPIPWTWEPGGGLDGHRYTSSPWGVCSGTTGSTLELHPIGVVLRVLRCCSSGVALAALEGAIGFHRSSFLAGGERSLGDIDRSRMVPDVPGFSTQLLTVPHRGAAEPPLATGRSIAVLHGDQTGEELLLKALRLLDTRPDRGGGPAPTSTSSCPPARVAKPGGDGGGRRAHTAGFGIKAAKITPEQT